MSAPVLLQDFADENKAAGLNIEPGNADGWETPPPVTLDDGTRATLYKDGEGLRAALAAIHGARFRVCLEMYIIANDATGRTFVDLLCRKARDGVRVYVIYDSFGSLGSEHLIRKLRASGARVAEFHPLLPWRSRFGWKPLGRDHRKLLVVDDDVAGLGGLNIGDEYAGAWVAGRRANLKHLMRDQAVGLQGPKAKVLLQAFAATWRYVHHGGKIHEAFYAHNVDLPRPRKGRRIGKQRPPARPQRKQKPIRDSFAVVASAPTLTSPVRPLLSAMLEGARESVTIIMAYFAPDDGLIVALCDAADRGVRVRLILPGRSDLGIMIVAAHSFYAQLLDHGIEIYERQNAVLHAKTMLIDGERTAIGSANLDYRSSEYNLEISALIRSREFGQSVQRMLDHDVRFSRQITADEWRRRPWFDRFVQWFVSRVRYVL